MLKNPKTFPKNAKHEHMQNKIKCYKPTYLSHEKSFGFDWKI